MQAQLTYKHLVYTLALCLPLSLLSGCKKSKKASEESLTELCLELAQNRYPKAALKHMEQRFFSDKKSRGLIKLSDLTLGSYREVESSATLGVYELLFYLVNARDEVTVLHNGPKTGGISLDQPNHISYVGACEIKWSHFKGSPLIKKFKLQPLRPDLVEQKIAKSKLKDRARMP